MVKYIIGIISGIMAVFVFYIINNFMIPVEIFFPGGDVVLKSYHIFTYTGLMILCGVIVACTCIIVGKLNEVKNTLARTNIKNDDKIKFY